MTAPDETKRTTASTLSYSRALLSTAKRTKAQAWSLEAVAALLSIATSFVPSPVFAVATALAAVGAKFVSKLVFSSSKRTFRLGERMRRYDFFERTIGWLPPPSDRADMAVAQQASELGALAAALAPREATYYSRGGPPSTERLFTNLAESIFWTERLMGQMAKRRWGHFAIGVVALLVTLAGLALSAPTTWAPVAIKTVGACVALLVAVDLFGEARSFARGEKEAAALLSALVAEIRSAAPARDEALRLMVEYNCSLADLPMIPDDVYDANRIKFTAGWAAFETSLPPPFRPS